VVDKESAHPQVPLSELAIPDHIREQLGTYAALLESHFQYVPQDIEFTYDGDRLWILQTRSAPLAAMADFRSAQHRINLGLLSVEEAITRIPSAHLNALVEPPLDPESVAEAEKNGRLLGEGYSVSNGSNTGRLFLSLADACQAVSEKNIVLADSNLESFAQLPANVSAVLLENAGIGSHLAREGTQLSSERNLIVVFGLPVNAEYEGQVVTVDGNTGKLFEGVIPVAEADAQTSLLSPMEFQMAQEWLQAKRDNPWRFIKDNPNIAYHAEQILEQLNLADEQKIKSVKAREITAFNAAIPQEIRQTYTVVKVDTPDRLIEKLRPILEEVFAAGNHATIRTCHDPALPANGPWALVRNMENFEQFLIDDHYSPKYGGFRKFLDNAELKVELTELLVGNIPVGKMEAIPEVQYQHSAWTLSCTENGLIVLQVHPHNPHLRMHEKARRENLITYTTHFDPHSPDQLAPIEVDVGENLQQDELALALGETARHHLFDEWWTAHDLPGRMAAVTAVLGINATFEGQATERWCLGYGIKTK